MGLDEYDVHGSGISLGRPTAATGAWTVDSANCELRTRGGGIGVLSMCARGGVSAVMAMEVA